MNSDKRDNASIRGNALIYILLALALLGALTMILGQQSDETSQDLSSEKAQLVTTKTVAYAGSVKNVIDQMMMSGSNINNLNYVTPNQTSFDNGSNINKVFHPSGGGLGYEPPSPDLFVTGTSTPAAGWYLGRFNNVEWTKTASQDIILAAYNINQSVCAAINKKITGSSAIPMVLGPSAGFFVDSTNGGPPNQNLTVAACSACEGQPALCVAGDGNINFTYYNIISGQ